MPDSPLAIQHSAFSIQLSVVVVSYNVRYFLEQALRSVERAAVGLNVEVFVVDNASSDGSPQLVKERFPQFFLIENKDNTGFSRANNQAIRQSRGEFVLLLNPDTLVEENTFRKCIDFMEKHPRAGGLGVRMLDGSGRFLPESKRGFPSPWVAFCKTFGLARLFPRSRTFNFYHLGHLSESENHEVDVLSGAFMFMRRAALDEVGLLDENFFMYGEDIDLSYRLTLGGWKNYYLSDAQIIHYKGESTKKGSLNYVRVFYQAMIIFAKKHFRGGAAGAYVAGLEAAIWLRAGLTVGQNLLKKIGLPLADAVLVAGGLVWLRDRWAVGYFNDPGHFTPVFWQINLPIYLSFWLGGIFLSGGYDDRYSLRRLLRGLAVGTLGALAVYGLLDLELRSSRILLLLGAVWAVAATGGLRAALHFFEFKNFQLGRAAVKNLVVVGTAVEARRARGLMTEAGVAANFIGFVEPSAANVGRVLNPSDVPPAVTSSLGESQNLLEIIRIYRATEIIFCSKDISAQEIIGWMGRVPPSVEVKILAESSLSIIGSHSKNSSGELYTIDARFALAAPLAKRNKVLNDWLICLAAAAASPVLVFFKKGRLLLGGLFPVLFLKKTWVGYSATGGSLPKIRPGIFSPLDGLGLDNPSEAVRQRLDFFYAKDWSAGRDWEVLAAALSGPA